MELRDKIIAEAGKLFVEHGTRQVTMDAIAQAMGISKRTIYENFKDKNDLLSSFLKHSIDEHKKKSVEIIKSSKNIIEALFLFGEYNQKMMQQVNPCFFEDVRKYHNEVFCKVMEDGNYRNYEVTYTILKRGINEGSFRKDIDLEVVNLFIHNSMDFFQTMVNEKKFAPIRIWNSVHLPYLRGISTEKGLELISGYVEKYKNSEE
jgi:AcrR family transcriptional regulator